MANDTAIEKRTEDTVSRVERTRSGRWYRPNVDILERAEELVVLADMPGVSADNVDVQFENGTLTIHGKLSRPAGPEPVHLLREYGTGDFYRTFQVSEVIDAGRIHAECADGVLTLHLPKVEEARPRRIAVKPS